VVPSPSWPQPFPPQQATDPSDVTAQEVLPFAATWTILRPSKGVPLVATGVASDRSTVAPSPIFPAYPLPQHASSPPSRTAHVCEPPASTDPPDPDPRASSADPGPGATSSAVASTTAKSARRRTARRVCVDVTCSDSFSILPPLSPLSEMGGMAYQGPTSPWASSLSGPSPGKAGPRSSATCRPGWPIRVGDVEDRVPTCACCEIDPFEGPLLRCRPRRPGRLPVVASRGTASTRLRHCGGDDLRVETTGQRMVQPPGGGYRSFPLIRDVGRRPEEPERTLVVGLPDEQQDVGARRRVSAVAASVGDSAAVVD
jgi:hypothetical protein